MQRSGTGDRREEWLYHHNTKYSVKKKNKKTRELRHVKVYSRPYSIAPVNENLNATILQQNARRPSSAQFSANPTRVMIIKNKNVLHITRDYAGKRTRACFNMVFFFRVWRVFFNEPAKDPPHVVRRPATRGILHHGPVARRL